MYSQLKHIALVFALLCLASVASAQNPNQQPITQKARFVAVIIETDQATIDKLIPKPYQCPNSKIIDINIGTWVRPDGSIFRDAFIQIPVMIDGKEVAYMPMGYTDTGKDDPEMNRKQASFQLNQYMNKIYFQVSKNGTPMMTADYSMGEQEMNPNVADRLGTLSLPEKSKPALYKISSVITRNFILKGAFSLDNLPEFPIPTIPVQKVQRAIYYEADMTITR